MASGSNLAKAALVPGNATRVQGVTGAQTVKNAPGTLWSLVIASADAAGQTVTVADNATTKIVLQIAAKQTITVPFGGLPFATSLTLTPSAATLDILALYD